MVTGTISLLLALNWGGMRYAWGSWQIAGLLAAAGALFALFFWRVATAPEPFVPLTRSCATASSRLCARQRGASPTAP